MTSVPRPTLAPLGGVNVVPTARTRQVASDLVASAAKETGFDAVIEHLHRITPEQYPALIGILLGHNPGRPRLDEEFTELQRLEAHRRFRAGDRDDWVMSGEREYQRIHKRLTRARQEEAS